jgi:hypothetical protein
MVASSPPVRRHRSLLALALPLVAAGVLAACQPAVAGREDPDDGGTQRHGPKVALNQIQVLASHNSYHVEPEPALLTALRSFLGAAADGFEYTHQSLAVELDAGVRQVELDVFVDDPGGGRYAQPKLGPLLGLDPVDAALAGPGLKVLHVQEVDYRSTCPTFVECLRDIRAWSDDHHGHLPITIQIEAKDDKIPDPEIGFVQPVPWTADAFTSLEAEIRSVFEEDDIISPGEVRGRARTLADAVRRGRWPTLAAARDRVMFVLDDKGTKRDAYRARVPDVDERLIFVDVPPGELDAAVMVVNDPVADAARIRRLVADGFIVRTRADANTAEARAGDTARREAAFASGAHFVSTDYVFPEERFDTGYVVDLPGDAAARCNPVSARNSCERADLSE